jgi:hypothetical protein
VKQFFYIPPILVIWQCTTFWYSDYGGETDVSLNCGLFYGPIVHPQMRMNGQRKTEGLGKKNLSQCHFVHHKSHWIDPGRRGERPATNRLSYGTALVNHLLDWSIYL